jgi:protein O-mannosyl-transferase
VRASSVCPKESATPGLQRRRYERRLLVAAVGVGLTAALPYAQTLGFGFVYDDHWTVVGNRHLDKPLFELLKAVVSGRALAWDMPDATRPMMSASLWLDRRIFGLSPAGHHLDSVALYVLVSTAAAALSFALLRRRLAALAAGLAFAVAPLHAEVVAAVNYREDLLAALGLFVGLAFLYWPAPRMARWRVYAASGAWGLAMLAKESALLGPLLFGALALVRPPPRALARQGRRLLGTALAVGLAWLVWRLGLAHLGEQIPRADHGSLAQTVLRTLRYETWAIASSLAPIAALPERAPLAEASAVWLLALLAVPLLVWGFVRCSSSRPAIAAVALAGVAALGTSPLAAPINELADRYCFVGSLAGALLVGWLTLRLARASGVVAGLFVACVSLAGLAASSRAASVWASEVALWTFAAETAPDSGRAWSALSRLHRIAGQYDLAERAAVRALEERPAYVPGLVARVLNDFAAGRVALGRERLAAIVARTKPQRDNLRVAERFSSQPDDAAVVACVREAVPRGMLLGDVELLRSASSRLLLQRHAPEPSSRDLVQ